MLHITAAQGNEFTGRWTCSPTNCWAPTASPGLLKLVSHTPRQKTWTTASNLIQMQVVLALILGLVICEQLKLALLRHKCLCQLLCCSAPATERGFSSPVNTYPETSQCHSNSETFLASCFTLWDEMPPPFHHQTSLTWASPSPDHGDPPRASAPGVPWPLFTAVGLGQQEGRCLPAHTWGCARKGRNRWGFALFPGKIKELHLGRRGSRIKSK